MSFSIYDLITLANNPSFLIKATSLFNAFFFSAGEGGEEGSPEEGEKLEGEEDTESMTPTSPVSPNQIEDDANSPPPGDIPSPASPRSINDDAANDRYVHYETLLFIEVVVKSFFFCLH